MEITFANKNISTVNGVLKSHVGVEDGLVYKECRRNHAASQGGHVLDGCGEFMPAPTATATDPISLRCMACGCHRNFHRCDPKGVVGRARDMDVVEYHPQNRHHPPPPPGSGLIQAVTACQVRSLESPPLISSTYHPTGTASHRLHARATNGGDEGIITTAAYRQQIFNNGNHHQPQLLPNSTRKRFRTKFSQEQKDRMQEFAENLEWKMVRSNDELVNGFCQEIGVERGVFKVWMHNNKNTGGKKSECSNNYGIIRANNQGVVLRIKSEYNNINQIEGDGNGIGNSHSSSISQEYNGTTHLSNASSS